MIRADPIASASALFGPTAWTRAIGRAPNVSPNKIEDEPAETRPRKTVNAATAAFLESVTGEVATRKKYSRIANHLDAFAEAHGLAYIDEFDLETLDPTARRRRVSGRVRGRDNLNGAHLIFQVRGHSSPRLAISRWTLFGFLEDCDGASFCSMRLRPPPPRA